MNADSQVPEHGGLHRWLGLWRRRRGLAVAAMAAAFVAGNAANASSTITRTSSWTYDSTGLLTGETVEPGSASALTTSYSYDTFGNKTGVTVSGANITSRTTTTTYDANGEFATKVTNPLNQSETWVYDPRFGVPTSHTGPNGLTTSWTYDTLGRKTVENRADGTATDWAYSYSNFFGSLEAFHIETSYTCAIGQAAPNTFEVYDTLGRPIESVNEIIYSGTTQSFAVADTQYDAFGRVAQSSLPRVATDPDIWTIYTYDALGRTTKTVAPNGNTTTYAYHGLTTSVTTPGSLGDYNLANAAETTSTTDNDMGLPVSVTDAAGATSTYTYDAVGDTLSVSGPVNNVSGVQSTTRFTYDNEGRKIGMADPDRGQWSYGYDALGELTSQTDGSGNNTSFYYDTLGRMIKRLQGYKTDVWSYDMQTNGIGKLYGEQTTNTSNNLTNVRYYFYDSLGRPSTNALGSFTPSGSNAFYYTTTSYDSDSRINTVSYPSGLVAQYSYTSIGTLSGLTDVTDKQNIWTLTSQNAAAEITQETLGNYIGFVNNQYDTADRLTATTAGPSSGGTTDANFSYAYDQLNDLTQRQDYNEAPSGQSALTETFGYDKLNRLTTDLSNPNGNKNYSYDNAGDLTAKSDTGTYSYPTATYTSGPSTHPHGVSSISAPGGVYHPYNLSTTYTYDNSGNQLTGDGNTIYWTTFNMVGTIVQGSTVVSYTYDANHNRISYTAPEGTTEYVNDPTSGVRSERITSGNGVTWKDYFFAGGNMVAMRVLPPTGAPATSFFIKDHLGSVAVVLNQAGGVVERDSYDAWGKRRNANGTDDVPRALTSITSRGFTGHEHVQDIGLINMNARLYDPQTGRFISTDPAGPGSTNMQAANPYSYVLNNPLSATDPTGMKCHGYFACTFGGFGLQILSIAVAVAFEQPYLIGLEAEIGITGGLANAVIAGAAAGAVGSDFSAQGALIGAAEAGAFYGVGSVTGGHFGANGLNSANQTIKTWVQQDPGEFLANVAGHGFVGGLASTASGGQFGSGFISAGFSDAAGVGLSVLNPSYNDIISESVIGGVSSVAGGGTFANGAETGAFGYLFNSLAQSQAQHSQGVAEVSQDLRSQGFDILGAEVPATIPGFPLRIYDLLVQEPDGSYLEGVEVKTSIWNIFGLNSAQVRFDAAAVQYGATTRFGEVNAVYYVGVGFGGQSSATVSSAYLAAILEANHIQFDLKNH